MRYPRKSLQWTPSTQEFLPRAAPVIRGSTKLPTEPTEVERGILGQSGVRGEGGSHGSSAGGSCGEGTVWAGHEHGGGGVTAQTVTSAEPPRGQLLVGGKGKRQRKQLRRHTQTPLGVGCRGEPKNELHARTHSYLQRSRKLKPVASSRKSQVIPL